MIIQRIIGLVLLAVGVMLLFFGTGVLIASAFGELVSSAG